VTNVTNREVDGVSVVTLYGRIVFGEGSNVAREKVKSLIDEERSKLSWIFLDMKNIDYIDSSGLGALVAAHLSANTKGAAMRLCNLGRKFSKVLQLTKLTNVFQVYSTEAAAVASFSK
jgi:anti-anti-sigma factor